MKKIVLSFVAILAFVSLMNSCRYVGTQKDNKTTVKVGVFNINGDSPWCIIDAIEAVKIDSRMEVNQISAAQIMSDELDDYDAILFPGGSGSAETKSLGDLGMKRIKTYVQEKGLAVVGICAGAYIMTNTPNYKSFNFIDYKAIDIEHDHRGHGIVQFSLSDWGKTIFPELKSLDTLYCSYYEGPVLFRDSLSNSAKSCATMLSDVHTVKGSPANMTNDRPFIVTNSIGKGKVGCFVGHPEVSPGMRWMIPRMISWCLNLPSLEYPNAVNPRFYDKEILFDSIMLAKQDQIIRDLKSTKEKKISAMNDAVNYGCWSAKKWLNGMLRDSIAEVRLVAAKNILRLERTDALDDINSAICNESDSKNKKILENTQLKLQNYIGCDKK
ncbi:MAG: hypothetical protein N4A49_16225 [Marinifilaceae bacterium]|jgi:hypothetical protein|nr:hypothetical protein [Marinifilaceae bacterium]